MSCGKVIVGFSNGDDCNEDILCGTTGPGGIGMHFCRECRDSGTKEWLLEKKRRESARQVPIQGESTCTE